MNFNRARLWLGVFMVVVFSAGLAAGAILGRRFDLRDGSRAPFGMEMSGRRGFGGPPQRMIERLARDLDLTEAQRRELDKVFTERRGRLEKFHEQVRAEFEKEQRDLRDAIRHVLTEEQRRRLDEVLPAPFMRRGPPRRRF